MEKFHSKYSEYLVFLTSFIKELPDHYINDPPEYLDNIEEIVNIFPTNDFDFLSANEDRVIKKAWVVREAVTALLTKIGVYINDESKGWFKQKKRENKRWNGILGAAMTNLRLSSDGSLPVSILAGGIGGINVGVSYGMDIQSLTKLQELWAKLNEG